jgi:hypothetical protein
MSEATQFRQYADEALRWAIQSKNAKERTALIGLARIWTQAAAESDLPAVDSGIDLRPMVANYRAM